VEIFAAAAELSAQQRQDFLVRECGGDDDLRVAVESLLSLASSRESSQQPTPHARSATTATVPPHTALPGVRIGAYRIVREIGSGGMGVVYEAVREEQFEKRVALKIIKQGLDSASIVRRFQQERQILAGLNHANITALLDGGTMPDGRPYFAMEYVAGRPILEYCDTKRLDTRERLTLFQTVCAAVQYAHQNLVVHRDLKPSNILVTDAGVPKLLDFGIAKILNADVTAAPLRMTVTIQVMTPEYATPEQIRGDPITTRTDVYSLGALLYELLTAHRPYRLKTRTLQEIARAICECEPETPSTAITRVAENVTPETVSATRGVPHKQLKKQLEGDVDNIVLKALQKDPARRYASVEQFSEDIRRHLTGLPVIARKDTVRYRTGKFIQRHKAGVFAAASVALALIGGMITTTWQARIANTQRARAERHFQDVRRLANSLLFELHDTIQNLPGATPARELLVKRALEYLDSLARESAHDSALLADLAAAYERVGDVQGGYLAANLGDAAGAITSYRKALAIRESLATEKPSDPALKRSLGGVHSKLFELLRQADDTTEALQHIEKAIGIDEMLVARDPASLEDQRNLASDYVALGGSETDVGNWKAGLENSRKGIALFEKLGVEHSDDVVTQRRLAAAYERTGEILAIQLESYGDALALFQKELAVAERLSAGAPLNTHLRRFAAMAHVVVGEALMLMKDAADAEPHLAKASEELQVLSAADPKNVQYRFDAALGLQLEAEAAAEIGQAPRAIDNLKRATALRPESLHAPWVADLVAANQFGMGKAYRRLHRVREACLWFDRSLPGLVDAQQHNRRYLGDSQRIAQARDGLRACAGITR